MTAEGCLVTTQGSHLARTLLLAAPKTAKKKGDARIYSWNVNGIRASTKKGLDRWVEQSNAEIIGLQEVRADLASIPEEILALEDYQQHYVAAEKKGYSGVGMLSRRKPDRLDTSLGEERFDSEGRLQVARFGRLVVARARTAATIACPTSSTGTAPSSSASKNGAAVATASS